MVRALREKQELENYQSHPSTEALKREASALHKAMQSKTEQEPKEQTNQQSDEKEKIPTSKDDNETIKNEYNYKSKSDKYFGKTHWILLGYLESRNRYGKIPNGQQGAWGMYQMRTNALKDTGYMDKNGNWSGKDGIKNENDFYNHPEIQEKAIRNLMDIFLYRLRNHLNYEGTPIAGKKDNFNITIRGMLAASHRVGQEYVKKYLNSLEKDKNGRYYFPYNKVSERDKEKYELVETRLRLFAD